MAIQVQGGTLWARRPGLCLHPSDVRAFGRLKGRRAKTGRLDARTIAEALESVAGVRHPIARTRKQLDIRELCTLRRSFIRMLNDLKAHLTRLGSDLACSLVEATIAEPQAQIRDIDRRLEVLL